MSVPEEVKKTTTRKRRTTTKKVEPEVETATSLKMSFPPREIGKQRGIGRSISNSISNTAEVIEEFSEGAKKALKTVGKTCDYVNRELEGLIAVTEAENVRKLVEIGYTTEYAIERLNTLAAE